MQFCFVDATWSLPDAVQAATLDSAISGSEREPGGSGIDTINITRAGTITVSQEMRLGTSGKVVKMVISGNGFAVSGGDSTRVFAVANNAEATIKNLVVSNGDVTGTNDGGVFRVSDSSMLSLYDSTISNSYAGGNGGGIFSNGSTVVAERTVFFGDRADGAGGAIELTGSGTGTALIDSSSFYQNRAGFGAAIYQNQSATLNVSNSSFYVNRTTDASGAVRAVSNGARISII